MKRAVLVGIDEYENENIGDLHGCVSDVKMLLPLLERNEDQTKNFECREYTAAGQEYVGRRELLKVIDAALAPGAEIALFYFAGHGMAERNDAVLVSRDGAQGDLGVPLSQILGAVQDSEVPEVMLILDCCFSGGAGGIPQLGSGTAALKKGVSILTASRNDQKAAELGHGLFSTYLKAALQGGAADVRGHVTLAGVYAYLSESFGAFSQRPTFKANVEQWHVLRECAPSVKLEDLLQLSDVFETEDHDLPLDPTFEPTAKVKKKNPKNLATFAVLQRYRAARLVEPVGTPHLYYAAMESKSCRLTPLGKHYWKLAKQGLL
jgi:hypothetical protein